MGEIKSVKVDNWGVFFLQKLQNFFNKTDYCDLTLQFRDNSQLKVHRLVLSACTDYFNVLEQTCDTIDDALIMPHELQADVVVPIVNFMYTGTLEFELKMYGKLLRTAKEMNMTVLLKLLEAHRRTMEGVSRSQRPPSPRGIRRRVQQSQNASPAPQISRSPVPAARSPLPARRVNTITTSSPATTGKTLQVTRTTPGTTVTSIRHQLGSGITILKTSKTNQSAGQNTIQSSINRNETAVEMKKMEPSSPFEQLRKGYNNNKRPPSTSIISPPSKKPNLEDVKEFAEQQRMRKQIAAEYGEDQEGYDQLMEDAGIHNDDDDDEEAAAGPSTQGPSTSKQNQPPQQQQQATQASRVTEQNTLVSIRHEGPDRQPTIIVRENGTTKLNHAKIIQEVLKKYPNLVKGSKNIKLKILPSEKTQRIVIKKDENESSPPPAKPVVASKPAVTISPVQKAAPKAEAPQAVSSLSNPPKILRQQILTPNVTVAAPAAPTTTLAPGVTANAAGKKRIDSKTMHALIALGAENRTGPWLCLRCGVNNRPISIPSYRGFRRHLINTHNESIDPALCEHCGYRSENDHNLHFHMQVEHKIKSNAYNFEECTLCSELFETVASLDDHMSTNHPDDKQQCIYCNKVFTKEIELYTHMKTLHKKQALDDGIIDASEDEDFSQDEEMEMVTMKDKKVEILSDITLQSESSFIKHDALQADGSNGNAPTPKFVAADGSEVVLTEEQRKQIISQLNQDVENGSVVMFLNENESANNGTYQEGEVTNSANEAGKEEEEVYDDSQIYEEMNASVNSKDDEQQMQVDKNESKESLENLEWAENLISAQDMDQDDEEEEHEQEADEDEAEKLLKEEEEKKQEDINKKLKELTGEWTEDEEEEEEMKDTKDEKHESEKPLDDVKTESTEDADEDDIDLALKNLHKESSSVEGEEDSQGDVIERLDEDIKTDEENSQPSTAEVDDNDNKMEMVEEEEHFEQNEEFLKSDDEVLGTLESQEGSFTKEEMIEEHVEHLEETEPQVTDETSANNNDMLLDDLINEAASSVAANEPASSAIETPATEAAEVEAEAEPEVEGEIETLDEELIEKHKSSDQEQIEPAEEEMLDADTLASLGEIQEDRPASTTIPTELPEEKQENEDLPDSENVVSSRKTPDAVKSLISDWADDIEEDEDEKPVI